MEIPFLMVASLMMLAVFGRDAAQKRRKFLAGE